MQQIPLQFELKVDATFDNFIEGENQLLLQDLQASLQDSNEFVYFYGEQGSGKTHLLQALAQSETEFRIAYIPLDFSEQESSLLSPDMLQGLEFFDAVCLDNIDAVVADKEWQTAIFYLYNQLKEQDKSLIVTAKQPPAQLEIELADLKSRLSAMLIHAIKPLGDKDKLVFLKSKALAKGLELEEGVGKYLLSRQQRDLASLNQLLEQLDKASLQAKRKLTIPFVKSVLEA